MEFRILGPLEVIGPDGPVALGGAKRRAVLAVLLLYANEPVSAERLALALWGEEAPRAAVKTVHVHLSRLRAALGPEALLTTTSAGYRLRVQPDELDLERFERLAEEGRGALAASEPERAAALLREALELWRGPPLADVQLERFAPAEIARLEELRLAAIESCTDAELAAGRHTLLVGELQRLVAAHPSRERLAEQLMLALYRCGRQADALAAFQATRAHLTRELGLEPGPALRALQAEILEQAPGLAAARREAPAAAHWTPPALPLPSTPMVGREREIAELTSLLERDEVRLATLTGPGGVGKTRVALAAARALTARLPATWVDLAAVARAADVASAIAAALAVTPLPGEEPPATLRRFLAERRLLLVIDNFEHVLPAAELIGELLSTCPGLTVLTTSRGTLDLRAEHRVVLEPLPLRDAAELFAAAARRQDSRFERDTVAAATIDRICERLDRLPLAIELAAARTTLLSLENLAVRLDRSLSDLRSGARDAPDRQQTLQATLEWSCGLLDADQQRAFARLAVFAGGCTLAAAESVCGARLDTLEVLADRSLLTTDAGERYRMLKTIREYATQRLEQSGEADEIRRLHHQYFARLIDAETLPTSPLSWPTVPASSAFTHERENIMAALSWALKHRRWSGWKRQ
jgi:predicted ATPase/DNA-binding SARP family transcriptional activator